MRAIEEADGQQPFTRINAEELATDGRLTCFRVAEPKQMAMLPGESGLAMLQEAAL